MFTFVFFELERARDPRRLFTRDTEHFDLKQQRAVRRNPPRRKSTGTVPFVRGNVEFDDLAHLGAETALVPPCGTID